MGDYGLILWEIEAIPYILHLSIPKRLNTTLFKGQLARIPSGVGGMGEAPKCAAAGLSPALAGVADHPAAAHLGPCYRNASVMPKGTPQGRAAACPNAWLKT